MFFKQCENLLINEYVFFFQKSKQQSLRLYFFSFAFIYSNLKDIYCELA